MPRGDGTGPAGMGPMTGRAAGYCAGFGTPGYANPAVGGGFGPGYGRGRGFGPGFGRGRGFGMGFGRGWRNWRWAAGPAGAGGFPVPYVGDPDPEMEKLALKRQADALQSELEMIKKRLSEVEAAAEK